MIVITITLILETLEQSLLQDYIVRQGPTALAVGASGECLDIFSFVYHFSLLSPSLGDSLIQTEILSQRAFKLKTTDQPNLFAVNYRFTCMFTCANIKM